MKHLLSIITVLILAVPVAGANKLVIKTCRECGKTFVQSDDIDNQSLCKACAGNDKKQGEKSPKSTKKKKQTRTPKVKGPIIPIPPEDTPPANDSTRIVVPEIDLPQDDPLPQVEEPQEIVYSRDLYKKAQLGDDQAQFMLGVCYDFGKGVKQDYKMAAYWYGMAAEQGNVDAMYNLGGCYDTGQGVPQSYEKAVYWYRKAANLGDLAAQFNVGVCYYMGDGVEQDFEMAVQWFRMAAGKGYASAQYFLGVCYENGEGVTQDLDTALKWYRKAAIQGDENAINALKRLQEK